MARGEAIGDPPFMATSRQAPIPVQARRPFVSSSHGGQRRWSLVWQSLFGRTSGRAGRTRAARWRAGLRLRLVGAPARIRERHRAWQDSGADSLSVRSGQPEAIEVMARAARLNW